jgi:serine/threonine protein kinase/Tfp pilus assembly protein PilF
MGIPLGTRLGAYQILGPLGAGGMGEVYRAKDLRLGREVAVKVLPAGVASSPERLARFEREARTVAGLNHPNIVTLHSVEDHDGIRFLTLELVEGQTLSTLITPGGLSPSRIVEIAVPLTDALVAAHERGVIHRDLKPGNVMVTREGRVKVLDFGLAKIAQATMDEGADRSATVESPLSITGQVVGTVPYMAPEQVRGEVVDARTDLFALGIILYELASGRRPFSGSTLVDLSSAILRDSPDPLEGIRSDLPRELRSIVDRCLEKDPRRRFQTALEIRSELGRVQEKLGAARSAAATGSPSIAVLPFVNMSRDEENEYFSDGLSEELLNVLARIPELKVTGRTSSFAFKGTHEDLRDIGQKLGVATLLEGSVRKAGNRVRITAQLIKAADGFHLWSETYDRVLDDIFAVQDDIARSVSQALHVTLLGKPTRAPKETAESYSLVLQANHFVRQNAVPAIARAVSLYREALEKCPDSAPAWAGLAKAHAYQAGYGYADTKESAKLARAAAERALALDDRLADAHTVMGVVLASFEFRFREGMESVRRAMALAPGATSPMVMMSFYEAMLGSMSESLRLARRAQEIDPLNAEAHANRGRSEGRAGNLEAASEAYLRALELSPEMTAVHSTVGLNYVRRGRVEGAIAEIQKEPSSGYRNCSLAMAYHIMGMKKESDEAMALLLAESEQWGIQFASAHAVRGEIDEAFHWIERSYELHDSGIVMLRNSWAYESLHADPRWPRLLEKIGLGEPGDRIGP